MVAQRYNLSANQVFRWRRLFRAPERAAGTGLYVPVVVRAVPDPEAGAGAMHPPSEDAVVDSSPATGRIEIVLPGARRVIVDRSVDGPALARVIAVLERR